MHRFIVVKAYVAPYPDPISLAAGEPVEVQRPDTEFPGWYWCRNRLGKAGWVHHSFLQSPVGTTVAVRPYSARELTVQEGQEGEVLERLDAWLYVRLDGGAEGWLPASHVSGATPGAS